MGSERIFLWVCRGSLEFFFLLWVGFGVLLQNLCKPNVKANRKVAQPTWGFGRSFDWFTRLTLTAAHFISRHNQDHTKAKKKTGNAKKIRHTACWQSVHSTSKVCQPGLVMGMQIPAGGNSHPARMHPRWGCCRGCRPRACHVPAR